MCRSIKTLRNRDQPASDEEVRAAALQFVRKISGFRTPTKKHAEAFDAAVDDITVTSAKLIGTITKALEPEGPARKRGSARRS